MPTDISSDKVSVGLSAIPIARSFELNCVSDDPVRSRLFRFPTSFDAFRLLLVI